MTNPGAPQLVFVGAGSLGQAFAALIAASGQQVTLLATPGSAARLGEAGRIRLGGVVSLEIPVAAPPARAGTVGVTAEPTRLPAHAGVLFVTKGHQLAGAIEGVRGAWAAGFQNGVLKDDLLGRAFGAERVVGAATILGAQREADGRVTVSGLGCTYLGELHGGTSARVTAAADVLRKAGIPVEESGDIRSVIWSKACNAAGIFGVSVLARVAFARLAAHPDLIRAFLALVRETEAVAAAHGVAVGDYTNFPIRTYMTRSEDETVRALTARSAPAAAVESFPSMMQDLLAGRPLEVDAVFDDLVARAESVGVPVPRLRLVRDLIRGLDPGRRGLR